MLSTYLNTLPYTKFVLIEDTLKFKGGAILDHIVKNHAKKTDYKTYFASFHNGKTNYVNITCRDFSTDCLNWSKTDESFKDFIANLSEKCVLIIDSLAHVIHIYGLAETYKILNDIIKNRPNIIQVVTLLHLDLLEEQEKIVQYLQHLSTLYITLEEHRLFYTYKKSQRKIISEVEEYRFENGRFISEAVKKPDPKIIEETINKIIPENMSTFKISLSDKDKESREQLVLPYLPKTESEEPKIHYDFDAVDDWDEEDPDDDLDI